MKLGGKVQWAQKTAPFFKRLESDPTLCFYKEEANILFLIAELLYLLSFGMKKFPLSITIVPFLQGLHPVCQLR